ncbi:MAG: class I SAM-dependent methyltransferase [Acidobacteria bacterium]|nr:class I SAM-dependent methyltransferase [Acidobacteriota bacterium]
MLSAVRDVLGTARHLGFLGPGPVEDHIDHARAFAGALPATGVCVDLGSGGGVPGLVLAVLLPATTWLLVDGGQRRTDFLIEAVAQLGLGDRVAVHAGRAEVVPADRRELADAVTARGFGPPPVLAECAAGWVRPGGRLVVSEPPGGEPGRWVTGPLAELGFAPPVIHPGPPALAVLAKVEATPSRFPRRVGVPAKRPLW